MELVDLVVVNKADGDLAKPANRALAEYKAALKLIQPRHEVWKPTAMTCSSVESTNIDKVWQTMKEFWEVMEVITYLTPLIEAEIGRIGQDTARTTKILAVEDATRRDHAPFLTTSSSEADVSNN